MSLPYQKNLIARAKDLRKTATRQEQRLWYDFLCDSKPRFQRQKVIGGYIVDFYCHAAKLVIELDGAHHQEEAAVLYDEERTRFLEAAGLRILRFSNAEVDQRFAGVCRAIKEALYAARPRSGPLQASLLEGDAPKGRREPPGQRSPPDFAKKQ